MQKETIDADEIRNLASSLFATLPGIRLTFPEKLRRNAYLLSSVYVNIIHCNFISTFVIFLYLYSLDLAIKRK